MVKRRSKKSNLSVYANLSHKHKTKKDGEARKRAEYLATLPKDPVKRFFYRLHPKRVLKYWFSKRGAIMALKIVGATVLVLVLTILGLFAYFRKDLDSIQPGELAKRVQTTVTRYYDRNGELLWEDKGTGNYTLTVDGKDISNYVKQATVAIEDKDFYSHGGVSINGIIRSLINNSQGGSIQGGSTLTQQLVKQVFFDPSEAQKRGLDGVPRKIKEIILAIEVERMYNKDQILDLYLNESPYGGRRNGVESGAQTYFGKSSKDLTIAESALLAAIPNNPTLYNPYNTDGNAALITRQHKVLDSMVDMGYITQAQSDEAKKVAILDTIKPGSDQYKDVKAPHFIQMVKANLEEKLGKATVGKGGLTVKTTLDIRVQNKLEESMNTMFTSNTPITAGFSNGAAAVEDNQTGQVIALVGSRGYDYPGFGQDNAATAFIQPGSSVKPFVYAKLFEDKGSGNTNYGSGSILADDHGADGIYGGVLRNADGGYKGAISIRTSLILSRNVPAVKAMYINGVDATKDYIRAAGDTDYCTVGADQAAGLSAAIGGCGTRLVDHVNAFATLAREGTYKPSSYVLEVKNTQGEVLESYKDESKQVMSQQSAYIVSDILLDSAGRGIHGTIYGVKVPGVKTATKTGTSDKGGQAKDIWMASYSSAVSMVVWLGNPDTSILKNGNSAMPAPIIGKVMEYTNKEVYGADGRWKSGDWLSEPSGVQHIGGELYPSWYNQKSSVKTATMSFDKVSKKKSTTCTPDTAKIDVAITTITDPISKKDVVTAADGYDATTDDNVHACDDVKPTVTIGTPNTTAKTVSVSVTNGRYQLQTLEVRCDNTVVSSQSITAQSTVSISLSQLTASCQLSATVTDTAYYTGVASGIPYVV